jgi:hypothetical protein
MKVVRDTRPDMLRVCRLLLLAVVRPIKCDVVGEFVARRFGVS